MLYKNLQGMNFAFPSEKVGRAPLLPSGDGEKGGTELVPTKKVGQAAATTLRIGRGGAVDRPTLTSRHGSEPTCLPNWRTG